MSDTHSTRPPVPPVPATPEEQKKRAEQAKADADKRRDEASKKLDEDDKARHEAVVEAAKREEGKPTPTQRELDLVKLGHTIEEHEDDGSGPEVLPGASRRDMTGQVGGGKYKTK